MKLRSRLGVLLALLVVPFAVGVALWQAGSQRRAFEEGTAGGIVDRMEGGERERCEASPESWPRLRARRRGPRRRPRGLAGRAWAYDASYRSANPRAPAFPRELREALEDGDEVASVAAPRGRGRLVAVRMSWDEGPCAIVVAQRPAPDIERLTARTLAPPLIVSAAAVLLAIMAAGPIVRRIRKLTEQVQRSEAESIDIGGRDEIADLARAFSESRARIVAQLEELERRDEALRGYMANTTHDVMIPVTVLQGHLSAMERALADQQPLEPMRVKQALEEVHYLASLLHNLNAAARLEMTSAEPRRDRVDLVAVVDRVVSRHVPFARQRSVELNHAVPEGELVVLGDVTLLEQAASNLVHNAIRYNHDGGHVAVVLEREGDAFHLRVIDDGPGIPDEDLQRVAERGFRGDRARSRHPHGLGLGLHIVRDVAERHGFTLRFDPGPERGLTVSLRGGVVSSGRVP